MYPSLLIFYLFIWMLKLQAVCKKVYKIIWGFRIFLKELQQKVINCMINVSPAGLNVPNYEIVTL